MQREQLYWFQDFVQQMRWDGEPGQLRLLGWLAEAMVDGGELDRSGMFWLRQQAPVGKIYATALRPLEE